MTAIEIINSDGNDPPWPFMIVERVGLHVNLAPVQGQLFDPTVARLTWGHKHPQGDIFGLVILKNGTQRTFWDGTLMEPYVKAYKLRKTELDAGIAAAADVAAPAEAAIEA